MSINVTNAQTAAQAIRSGELSFDEAVKKFGEKAINEELSKIGGDPGAPVDGYQKTVYNYQGRKVTLEKTYTRPSGRQVLAYKDINTGEMVFAFKASDGTQLDEKIFRQKEGLPQDAKFAVDSKGKLVALKEKRTIKIDGLHDDNYYAQKRIRYNNEAVSYREDASNAWKEGRYIDALVSYAKGVNSLAQKNATPENSKDAMKQEAGFGGKVIPIAAGLLVAAVSLSSCMEYNLNQGLGLHITPDSSLKDAINALLLGQEVSNQILAKILEREIQNGTTLEEIKDLIGGNTVILNTIINAMVDGNKLLTDIKNSITTGQEDMLETLYSIKNSINVITDLIAGAPDYSEQLEEIKNAISQGNQSSQDIMAMLEKLFEQVVKNGDTQIDISAKLDEIKNSNISDGEKLAAMLELLKNIDSTTQDINNKLDELNSTITEINNKLKNDPDVKAALDKLIELVGQNNEKADITNQLLEKLISMYDDNRNITKEDIAAIINAINKNGEKIDETNQLLAKMQDQDEKFQAQVLKLLGNVGADYTDVLNKILDAVNKGNAKLDDVTKLLAKMQNQDLEFQENVLNAINDLGTNITGVLNNILTNIGNDSTKLDQITQLLAKIDSNIQKYGEDGKALGNNILNAINKLGSDVSNISAKLTQILEVVNADKDTGKNIEELLNKVLANMDSNTAKIIDAIANIKIEGGGSGNVDLTSVEAMLKELVELTKDNNNTLTDINGKLDVIKVTQQAILDKINVEANKNDERYTKLDAFMKEVLEKLSSSAANGYDDSKLMEVLSKLSNMIDTRLEEILNAIKDHDVNVTVDVTGKVTCECNCGKPHEGILGDLEDALG